MESERKGQDLFGSPGSSWVLITVGAPSGSWGLPGAPRGPGKLEGRSTLGFLVAHTNSKKPSGA